MTEDSMVLLIVVYGKYGVDKYPPHTVSTVVGYSKGCGNYDLNQHIQTLSSKR